MADESPYQYQFQFSRSGNAATRPSKDFKRTYKACLSCRRTKAKCEIIEPNGPCMKCQRERRDCVFSIERSVRKKRDADDVSLDSPRATKRTPRSMNSSHYESDSRNIIRGLQDGRSSPAILSAGANDVQHSMEASNSREDSQVPSVEEGDENGLDRDVIRTVVSSSNDALGLLFRAAEQQEQADGTEAENAVTNLGRLDDSPSSVRISNTTHVPLQISSLSTPSAKVSRIWQDFRFVRMGWFTAVEAVTFIDLFFRNLYPLTPILTKFYANHENHAALVSGEPLLCCTMLMISSRHHILPGPGGLSRAQFIHTQLWKHCEHLVQRITFSQEKYSNTKTRTLGSIEALLLMTEWHARALHFPPEADGWDASLAPDIDNSTKTATKIEDANLVKWREEVFEPAKRSDRMSWMILGLATTLAHELGVFESLGTSRMKGKTGAYRSRICKLLFIYVNQLASRLGCSSLLPHSVFQSNFDNLDSTAQLHREEVEAEKLITLWIDITKLLKSATEMFFSNPLSTTDLLKSGRYISLLEHFQPLLAHWKKRLNESEADHIPHVSRATLSIEYQYLRMYINSLAIQALVERATSRGTSELDLDLEILKVENRQDLRFIQEVTEASAEILQTAISLANEGVLLFVPIRVLLRITSASIFLLKAISLGARNADLQKYLGILDRCIQALRSTSLDDMHLSARYATLIERLVKRFRRNFRVRSRLNINELNTAPSQRSSMPAEESDVPNSTSGLGTGLPEINELAPSQIQISSNDNLAFDDWLSQPFDASIAPFGLGSAQTGSGFEEDSLDFLWSLDGLRPS